MSQAAVRDAGGAADIAAEPKKFVFGIHRQRRAATRWTNGECVVGDVRQSANVDWVSSHGKRSENRIVPIWVQD